jgi:hypothetical protein
MGLTAYKDCINVTYDTRGNIYEIPNYCINDPSIYDIPKQEVKPKPRKKDIKVLSLF